jgi:hypothetical protein
MKTIRCIARMSGKDKIAPWPSLPEMKRKGDDDKQAKTSWSSLEIPENGIRYLGATRSRMKKTCLILCHVRMGKSQTFMILPRRSHRGRQKRARTQSPRSCCAVFGTSESQSKSGKSLPILAWCGLEVLTDGTGIAVGDGHHRCVWWSCK